MNALHLKLLLQSLMTIRNILFLIPLIVGNLVLGQSFNKEEQKALDSLSKIIHSRRTIDTVRVNSMFEVANLYYLRDPDSAIALSLAARQISEKLDYHSGKLNSYGWLGYMYQQKGDIKQALNYSLKSLELIRKKGTPQEESTMLSNIGYIYSEQGNLKEALEYYRQGLKIQKEENDLQGIAITYNNLGLVGEKMGQRDSAVYYYTQSLELRKKIGDKKGMARTLSNIATIYSKENRITEALDYFTRSIAIDEELVNKQGMAIGYFHLGSLYLRLNKLDKAIQHAEYSLKIGRELDYPDEISTTAELLSRLYAAKGESQKALDMYKLSVAMRDRINNAENKKALAQQQAKYEYEKQKVIDDARHKKQLDAKERDREIQRLITYGVASGLFLVMGFLFIIFRRLRITRNQKKVIEVQKQEIVDSISYARRIQSAILPTEDVMRDYLGDAFVLYLPKDIVAGDFYWTAKTGSTVLFAVADCTGHGVPGALVSVVCHNAMNRACREYVLTEPAAILEKTRELVVEQFGLSSNNVKDGMDIALCAIDGYRLRYSGANNPVVILRNGELIELKGDRQPIGVFENAVPFRQHEMPLQSGDTIYLYTDGFADQFGGNAGKKFKQQQLKSLLLQNHKKALNEQREILENTFRAWQGKLDQVDDVCVMGIRIK